MVVPWWRLGADQVLLECTGDYNWTVTVQRTNNVDVSTEVVPKSLPDTIIKCTAVAPDTQLDYKLAD